MTRRGHLLQRACAAALLAAWIGGCSGHDGPSTPAGPADGEPGHATPDGAVEPFPFNELLGLTNDPIELHDRSVEAAQGYADEVTRCVRELGYPEFTEPPEEIPSVDELAAWATPTPGASELDHGYGAAESVDLAIANATTDRSASDDQLLPFYAAMTPEARQAFFTTTRQCFDAARAHHPDPRSRTFSGPGVSAYQEIQEVRASFGTSTEALELWARWAGCMGDAGYAAATREELAREISGPSDQLLGRIDDLVHAADGVIPADTPALAAIRTELEALRDREQQSAADDRACAEPLDLDARLRALQVRLEREYIEEHGDELRKLVAGEQAG